MALGLTQKFYLQLTKGYWSSARNYNKIAYFGSPADMWALGILLYLMLYGEISISSNIREELYRRRVHEGEGLSALTKETVSKLLKCPIQEN